MEIPLRPMRASDLDAAHQLQRRVEEHDRIPIATPRAEFEELLDEPHFDLARDARVVEIDGAIVAWGRIWHQPSSVREERAYVRGAVAPERRRQGIGSALLHWQIGRAFERLESSAGRLPRFVRCHAYDFEQSSLDLYQRHGMRIVRYGDELLRDLDAIPVIPELEGIRIVPWDSALSEKARVSQNDAFADHWGSTPRDAAMWQHVVESYGMRLDLSFLALDGSEVVGVCRNGHFPDDEAVTGRRDGWIVQVSVSRSHRKRGIASALIVESLAAFRRAGLTHSALGVDSENPTGAYQLYERLGYRRMRRAITFQIDVDEAERNPVESLWRGASQSH